MPFSRYRDGPFQCHFFVGSFEESEKKGGKNYFMTGEQQNYLEN